MRPILAASLASCGAILVLIVAGCGTGARTDATHSSATHSSTLRGDVLVQVGHYSITKAQLDHWTAVEATLAYEYDPRRPVPKGVVPDPPTYRNCMAYFAAKAKAAGASPTPTTAQLRGRCEQQDEDVQNHILDILITDFWVREEARRRGIGVTASEVEQTVSAEFASAGSLRRFLTLTGERASEHRFLIETQMLLAKMQRSVRANRHEGANEVDIAIQKLANEMAERWAPQTSCRVGYAVSECGDYNTAKRPERKPVPEEVFGT